MVCLRNLEIALIAFLTAYLVMFNYNEGTNVVSTKPEPAGRAVERTQISCRSVQFQNTV